jgi:hypothetical protein
MVICQVPGYLRQRLGITFPPGILPFTLETLTLPTNLYIVIFEVKKNSFRCYTFMVGELPLMVVETKELVKVLPSSALA